MADVIVTYVPDGWNHLTAPSRGSLVLYPDGLLNVLDATGRTMDVKRNVMRVELMQEPYIEDPTFERPKPTP